MFQTKIKINPDKTFCDSSYLDMSQNLENYISQMPIAVQNVDQLTDLEFSKIRNAGFGASDSSVLLEVAYSTAKVSMTTIDNLLYNKEHEIYDEDISSKASVRKGKDLESLLIKKSEKILDAVIIKPTNMYTNNKGLNTNFDGIIFEPHYEEDYITTIKAHPLEIKLCTVWARKNYDWNKGISEFDYNVVEGIPKKVLPELTYGKMDIQTKIKYRAESLGIPTYYYTQVQQQILFTGSDHGYLAVMDDSEWTMYYFYIPRDDEVIKALESLAYQNYIILCKRKGIKLEFPDTEDI